MNKGINTAIEETKVELLNFVNAKLQMGLPISAMGLIIDNMSNQLKNKIVEIINVEQQASETPEESEVE